MRVDPGNLETIVEDCLKRHGVKASDSIVCAFSGGPDSSALALCLAQAARHVGFSLALAYIDHGLRPEEEMADERERVRDFAVRFSMTLRMVQAGRGAIAGAAAERGCGIEAAAREARYAMLRLEAARLGAKGGRTWIATGHHADDQDETCVMRVFSGSGSGGLRGIPERNGEILRPLLSARRAQIEAYLGERAVKPCRDSSNAEAVFLRNRLRACLMPAIASVFPGYAKALASLREKAALEEDCLRRATADLFKTEGDGMSIGAADWLALHPALRIRSLQDAAGSLIQGARLPFAFIKEVSARLALAAANGRAARISGKGLVFRLEKGRLEVIRRLAQPGKKGYFFNVSGPAVLDIPGGGRIRLYVSPDPGRGPALACVLWPAVLRSPRPYDSVRTRGGDKTVSSLLREWSLPAWGGGVALLEDRLGIVCVYGVLAGRANRYAERGYLPGPADACLGAEFLERGAIHGL